MLDILGGDYAGQLLTNRVASDCPRLPYDVIRREDNGRPVTVFLFQIPTARGVENTRRKEARVGGKTLMSLILKLIR